MTFLLVLLIVIGAANGLILRWLHVVTYQRGVADGRELERKERIAKRAASMLHRDKPGCVERKLSIVGDDGPRGVA